MLLASGLLTTGGLEMMSMYAHSSEILHLVPPVAHTLCQLAGSSEQASA